MARSYVMVNGQKVTTYNNNPKLKAANNRLQFTAEQFEEYVRCATDVVYFCENYVKVVSLDEGIVPFNMWDFQKRMVESYSKNRFNITMCPRQVGKSITVICGFILHELLFKDQQNWAILANKGALARDQLEKLQLSYEQLPMWLQQGVVTWNKGSILLENGSKVIAAATSASAVRGNSYNGILLDEFAHVQTNLQEKFFNSTYPTLAAGKTTKMIIISTPLGMNLFYKLWTDAVEGRSDYVPLRVYWHEVPGRDEEYKRQTIANTSQRQWDQEQECVIGETLVTIKHKVTGVVETVTMNDLYNRLQV